MINNKILQCCFDSHVHWLATGRKSCSLDLSFVKNQKDLSSLTLLPNHYIGEWLVGFGWHKSLWENGEFPSRQNLDKIFNQNPVCFTSADGHAIWVNSLALERSGLLKENVSVDVIEGGYVFVDEKGCPTGIFVDQACQLIKTHIPKASDDQIKQSLLSGQKVFHENGFSHIRDLSCGEKQWVAASDLDQSGELKLAVEEFVEVSDPDQFDEKLYFFDQICSMPRKNLRLKGLKIYYDGALGTEGALISQPYPSGLNGIQMIQPMLLIEMLKKINKRGVDLAIHVIGDKAVHDVSKTISEFHNSEGFIGRIHLEHVEVLRPETLKIIKSFPVTIHMQPCHWLMDRIWLEEKLGALSSFSFSWHAIEEANIEFYWGSDSPIEPPSVVNNYRAYIESQNEGRKSLKGCFWSHHQHSDRNWVPETFTEFQENQVSRLVFNGETIINRV